MAVSVLSAYVESRRHKLTAKAENLGEISKTGYQLRCASIILHMINRAISNESIVRDGDIAYWETRIRGRLSRVEKQQWCYRMHPVVGLRESDEGVELNIDRVGARLTVGTIIRNALCGVREREPIAVRTRCVFREDVVASDQRTAVRYIGQEVFRRVKSIPLRNAALKVVADVCRVLRTAFRMMAKYLVVEPVALENELVVGIEGGLVRGRSHVNAVRNARAALGPRAAVVINLIVRNDNSASAGRVAEDAIRTDIAATELESVNVQI